MYKTYEFDLFGLRKQRLICWLYTTDHISMGCRLCEKFAKRKNSNGNLIKNSFLSFRVYVIFIYNTKILLPLTFDEQTDKNRYASTGNRTHDQDWFT